MYLNYLHIIQCVTLRCLSGQNKPIIHVQVCAKRYNRFSECFASVCFLLRAQTLKWLVNCSECLCIYLCKTNVACPMNILVQCIRCSTLWWFCMNSFYRPFLCVIYKKIKSQLAAITFNIHHLFCKQKL